MKDNLIKILGVLLVTGGVCVGIAFWVKKNMPEQDLSASILKSFADKDSDHDGLSDNMESVYGTDYMDPDSDGDGFLDGEEVLSGYDPMKPAPDDRLNTKYTIMPRPAAGSMKDLNFTSDLVSNLTNKITSSEIQPQRTGDITTIANPSTVEEAMEAAMQRSYQEFTLPSIPADQLNITIDNGKEAIKEYAKKTLSILNPIMNISIIDIDEGKNDFESLINLCENTAIELKKVKTPSNAASLQKKQIGLLMIQANILKALANIEGDPLKATIAFSQVENINKISEDIFKDITGLSQIYARE